MHKIYVHLITENMQEISEPLTRMTKRSKIHLVWRHKWSIL